MPSLCVPAPDGFPPEPIGCGIPSGPHVLGQIQGMDRRPRYPFEARGGKILPSQTFAEIKQKLKWS